LRLSRLAGITFLFLWIWVAPALPHEVRPAIADVTVSETRVEIEISLTLEALVAGLDLTELQDTNASPLSQRYDDLRALNAKQLEQALRVRWPDIVDGFNIFAGSKRMLPQLAAVEIGPAGNIDLPRESVLRLDAMLPDDESAITVGWSASYGPLVVRQVTPQGDGYSVYLTGGELSAPLPRTGTARQPWLAAFLDYIGIGFEHIVPKGLDHILFVLGLFFFSLKLRPLLVQVTAFTVAHTVALALGILGYVQVSPGIVEPLIAASIVYVAVENIVTTTYRKSRTLVVFGFGLLHGLGFAAVLGEIGLNPGRFITGLVGFNIGVELGQITVIALAYLAVGLWFGQKCWYRRVIAVPASLAIAIIGAFWLVQRVFF
jgi:hypothetical protein